MPDQAALAHLVTDLMDKLDAHFADDAVIADAALVVEVIDGGNSSIIIQSNQLRKHAVVGLLMTAEQIVATGQNEVS